LKGFTKNNRPWGDRFAQKSPLNAQGAMGRLEKEPLITIAVILVIF